MLYQRYIQAMSNGFISGSKSYRQIIEKNIKATSQIQVAKMAQAIKLAKLTQQLSAPIKRPFSVIKHASAINNWLTISDCSNWSSFFCSKYNWNQNMSTI